MTTAVTPKVTRTGGGMPKVAFLKPYRSMIDGRPFLDRFILFFTPYAGCHITWIRQADNQREWPHDHSATFISFRLLGGYEEDVFSGDPHNPAKQHRRHKWLSASVLRHDQAHSITSLSRWGALTVLFLGRRQRTSSYWTPEGLENTGMKMDEEW